MIRERPPLRSCPVPWSTPRQASVSVATNSAYVSLEHEVANTVTGPATTIDFSVAACQSLALVEDTSLTLSFPCVGHYQLKVSQGMYPAVLSYVQDILWAEGRYHSMTFSQNAIDIVDFYWDGTRIFASVNRNMIWRLSNIPTAIMNLQEFQYVYCEASARLWKSQTGAAGDFYQLVDVGTQPGYSQATGDLSFNGTSFRLNSTLKPTAVGSLCIVGSRNPGAVNRPAFGSRAAGPQYCFIGVNAAGQWCGGIGTQDGATIFGAVTASSSRWAQDHVVLTWDGVTVFLYVNGVQVYTGPQVGVIPVAVNIDLGRVLVGVYWSGYISDASVFSDVLTGPEVAALAAGTTTPIAVGNCTCWLKTRTDVRSLVIAWDDSSPLRHEVRQTSQTLRPLSANSSPVGVEFDGVDDYLVTTSPRGDFKSLHQEGTVLIEMTGTKVGTGVLLDTMRVANTNIGLYIAWLGDGRFDVRCQNGVDLPPSVFSPIVVTALTPGVRGLFAIRYSVADGWEARVDGVVVDSGPYLAVPSTAESTNLLTMGAQSGGGGSYYGGAIHFVTCYETRLSDADMALAEAMILAA
jgi:hypothetical protein